MADIGATNQTDGVVLEVEDLSKVFPGTIALQNASIQFKRGEIHGIVGKNGAGKSTLVNILSGILHPSSGKIIVKGKEFSYLTPGRARKEGVTIVTQNPEIIPDFNLVENLFMPGYEETGIKLLKWRQMYAEAKGIFERVGFDIDLTRKMSDLTLDEKQVFLILKAFYVDKQDLVLLDEVTTSFSEREEEFFFKLIDEQRRSAKSIIFISHRLDEVLTICDRITVIRDGKVAGTAERHSIGKEDLCSMVVGTTDYDQQIETVSFEAGQGGEEDKQGDEVLAVEGLTREGFFEDVSFGLRKGEILGLAGLVGSGRTDILKAISGIEPAEKGCVVLERGEKRRFSRSWNALRCGIVYLTENRDEEGLISMLSVRKNMSLSFLARLGKGFLLNSREEKGLVTELVNDYEIVTSSIEEEVENLSGGNRQKVLCGRIASTQAKVLLLDEPTKGIDIAAKVSILRAIRDKMSQSAGVILTSPGLEDLLTICDRILVLFDGRITGEFKRRDFNELEIYRAIQGLETAEQEMVIS